MPAAAERVERRRATAAPKPRQRTRTTRTARPQPRVASGVAWIAVVAVLLAGVVAMNVAVLRLNLGLDEVGRERARLRAESGALASRISSASAAARIQSLARVQLGLVPAEAADTTYVQLR